MGGDGATRKLVMVAGGGGRGRVRECGSGTSEVERVDKMWSGRWPGLEKGERRVWGHHDTRVCGGRKADKKESTNAGEMVRESREPAGRRPQGSADKEAPPFTVYPCNLNLQTLNPNILDLVRNLVWVPKKQCIG